MKNVIKIFKAAADLCNDYRDTIFYTAGAVAIGYNEFVGGIGIESQTLVIALTCREFARIYSWARFNTKNAYCSAVGSTALHLCNPILDTVHSPSNIPVNVFAAALSLASIAFFSNKVGGLRSVLNCYAREIFDYPRKIKPPRDWKKDFSAVSELVARVKEALTPPGVPSPARFMPRSSYP